MASEKEKPITRKKLILAIVLSIVLSAFVTGMIVWLATGGYAAFMPRRRDSGVCERHVQADGNSVPRQKRRCFRRHGGRFDRLRLQSEARRDAHNSSLCRDRGLHIARRGVEARSVFIYGIGQLKQMRFKSG